MSSRYNIVLSVSDFCRSEIRSRDAFVSTALAIDQAF